MDNSFSVTGVWWTEDNASQPISGWLEFNKMGDAYLKTIGKLFAVEALPHPPVLGETSIGDRYTLVDCRLIRSEKNEIGIRTYRVKGVIIKGWHFPTVNTLLFTQVTFQLEQLKDWLDLGLGIKYRYPNEKGGFSADYLLPKPFQVEAKDFNMEIGMIEKYHFSRSRVSIEEVPIITLSTNGSKNLNWFLHRIDMVRSYFTIIFGVSTCPYAITVQSPIILQYNILGESLGEKTNEVFNATFEFVPNRGVPFPYGSRPIFSDIGPLMLAYFNDWCDLFESHKIIMPLFFTGLNSEHHIQAEFLIIAQAIEAYHRTIFGGHYIEEEKFRESGGLYDMLLKVAKPLVDRDFYQSLKMGKFAFLHHYSLNKRLKNLISRIPTDSLRTAIFGEIKPTDFADYMVGTRNYLTHWDKQSHTKVTGMRGIYLLTHTARNFLLTHLLLDIDLPPQFIELLLLPFPDHYDILPILGAPMPT